MAPLNLTKAHITVGDIYHLRPLPGHERKTKKSWNNSNSYSSDDDKDEDDSGYCLEASSESDGPSRRPSRRPSEWLLAMYTAEGLDWRITDHPVVVTGLMEGNYGYDSKVLVCQMTSRQEEEMIGLGDRVEDSYCLPHYPRSPTLYYPGIQLRLEHHRVMLKPGYVDYRASPAPIRLLEKCNSVSRHEIGYLRLDQESIEILRVKSSHAFSVETTKREKLQCLETNSWGPLHRRCDHNPPEIEVETPLTKEEEAECVYFSSWRWRILAELADDLHAGLPSDFDKSMSIMQGLASNVDAGLDGCVALKDFIDDTTTLELERHTTVSPIFQGNLFGRPFMISNPGCSLPRAFFNELVFQASESSVFPQLKRSPLVKLGFYYEVTTSLPGTDLPVSQVQEDCRVRPTQSWNILSIWLPRQEAPVGKESGIGGDVGRRTIAARSGKSLQLLLCQRREGLRPVIQEVNLTKRGWKQFLQECGRPDVRWEGRF